MRHTRAVRRLPWILAALAVTLLVSQGAAAAQGAQPPAVVDDGGAWTPVARGTLTLETPAVGSMRAAQSSKLGPQVGGRVEAVLVDVGDVVKKGQKLVEIDPTFFQIELDQRKADVATARARVDSARQGIQTAKAEVEMVRTGVADAELELRRMKSLWEKPEGQTPSIPQRMYDEAKFRRQQEASRLESVQSRLAEVEARLIEAQSGLKQAEQAVKWAEQRLAETTVRAPYDAVVTARLVDPGEPVTSTPITHLVEVKEVANLELEFSLPQKMLSRVKRGTPVKFEVEGIEGGRGDGSIDVVYPDMDEATRAFRCKVLVQNQDGRYRPGLLVQVRIADQRPDAIVVPRRALRSTADGWQVRVQGQTNPRPVEVGLTTETEAEILSGLAEGELLYVPKAD